jgi:adenylate cyclase
MRTRLRLRDFLALLLTIAIVSLGLLATGPEGGIAGLSTDTLFWLRNEAFGPRRQAAASPVAVVLIDEATYAAFKDKPKDFWSPYFGAVIGALSAADAKVIGFDIILPISIGPLLKGYDKDFWAALQKAGPAGKLVMIRGQSGSTSVGPSREQLVFLGPGNVRSDAVQEDADSVVRRQPLTLPTVTPPPASEPGFAAELASRAGWKLRDGTLLLNFDGGHAFETWSLADLFACAKVEGGDFFAQHFRDRVVLIGTGLQFEDRLLTSSRFINPPEILTGARCTPATSPEPVNFARDSIPGVFIHATAVDNLLRGEGLISLPPPGRVATVVAGAALGAALGLTAGFLVGGICMIAIMAGLTGGATMLFHGNIETPLLETMLAVGISYFLMLGFRLVITERGRRRIRQMFGLYLAPSVIAQLEAMEQLPERGGERRRMTFFFSDISGFTTLTEAEDLMELAPTLNSYFDGVCAAVEAAGGIVIEFLGDGVQAMFGAPADQPDHAARAIAAARSVSVFTEQFRSEGTAREMGFGHTRLGVHTGDALVGNIGASQRLKYAALGDVVNATSRLEGLNKYFGTRICISEETAEASGDPDLRWIGDFLVKGKSQPIRVFELLAPGSGSRPWLARYRQAHQMLSTGDIAVEEVLTRLAAERPEDEVVRYWLTRARSGELGTVIQMQDK